MLMLMLCAVLCGGSDANANANPSPSVGTNLVKKAIYAMVEGDCDEVKRACRVLALFSEGTPAQAFTHS